MPEFEIVEKVGVKRTPTDFSKFIRVTPLTHTRMVTMKEIFENAWLRKTTHNEVLNTLIDHWLMTNEEEQK